LLKDEKGDVHAHSNRIFNRRKKHLCQLLDADWANVGQTEIHTAELLVRKPSAIEGDMAVEKLQRNYQVMMKFDKN
jgi:hypothetical protein